jgi:CheY-like chemotaxis protein
MNAETLSKAFEPFFTTKPVGAGTGLGLSMVYGFAKQSGGQIRIHSEPGRGTHVYLQLPYRPAQAVAPVPAPKEVEAELVTSGGVVLVVDDEASVRMFVTETLGSFGYHVIEAADGLAALQLLGSDTPIDLLVTDIGLPGGLDGRQLAEAGRECRPQLPVLFMTGYARPSLLDDCTLQPATALLIKPFALEALIPVLNALLGTAEGSGQASAQ